MIGDQQIIEIIQAKLSARRFQHSMNVAQTARTLAQMHGENPDIAYTTGLLHDYAKGISGDELLRIAEENNLIEVDLERQLPDLLHAPVGAYLVERELKLHDVSMLEAIRVHTLGSLDMSLLDKIIFLADMIEPGRDYPGLQRLQCLTERDLDQAMLFAMESTIRYCLDQGRLLHPRTIEVRNRFLEIINETS
ncbi:MAG: bis(5'-nucleosyl)-tetraphosphatase (symmetrical) YqeK [Bacillota bacterium]|nr:bis(5'-nucleosyl)-tetraphosphatase (symmetrical) YqeK [Bacillota bacterium]